MKIIRPELIFISSELKEVFFSVFQGDRILLRQFAWSVWASPNLYHSMTASDLCARVAGLFLLALQACVQIYSIIDAFLLPIMWQCLRLKMFFSHWQPWSQPDDRSSVVAEYVYRKEVMVRNGFHCSQGKKKAANNGFHELRFRQRINDDSADMYNPTGFRIRQMVVATLHWSASLVLAER